MGCLVGFHPVLRYSLPRSSETWSHLENLDKIPGAVDALDLGRMLDLFENRQHYTKYPLFYVVAKALSIDSPFAAGIFSAAIFSIMPLLVYLLAKNLMDDLEAFTAGILVSITSFFVYTMNFFSGGEPLAFAVFLAGLYIYTRHRPLLALPLFLIIIILHPFTSLFLWAILLVLLLLGKNEPRQDMRMAACTSIFSFGLIGWLGFQIARGLPLGGLVTTSVPPFTTILVLSTTTLLGILLAVGRLKLGVDAYLRRLSDMLALDLPKVLVVLEVILISLFLVVGITGTEKTLTPSILIFYSPVLILIALVVLRRDSIDTLTVSMSVSFLVLMAIGFIVFPGAFPTYRLAPYGTLCLALLISPSIRDRRMRIAIPLVILGLAATTYPGSEFYFGFDEQYYPSEMAALDHLSCMPPCGRLITDVRMEDLVRYKSGRETKTPHGKSIEAKIGDQVVVTANMRDTGLYPPGAEWYRIPYKIDLHSLEVGSEKLYDNGQVELFLVTDGPIELEEVPV
jgi:hypothetical protein